MLLYPAAQLFRIFLCLPIFFFSMPNSAFRRQPAFVLFFNAMIVFFLLFSEIITWSAFIGKKTI